MDLLVPGNAGPLQKVLVKIRLGFMEVLGMAVNTIV